MKNFETIKKIVDTINQKLNENHIYEEAFWRTTDGMTDYEIEISIDRGDWKHDHLRVKHIIREVLGNNLKGEHEVVTWEDGSDCYSAIHYFTTNIKYKDHLVFELG